MNDNRIRGKQWKKLVAEYLFLGFGGDLSLWEEANAKFIKGFIGKGVPNLIWENRDKSYHDFMEWYIQKWINDMFDYAGIERPEKNTYKKIYYEVVKYVDLRVNAAFPSVIESIENLFKDGYTICTSSGLESIELKYYLQGMKIKKFFKAFYGPDLLNISKIDDTFFRAIFRDLDINPEYSIVIDDKPYYLKNAEKTGANVIQACLSGEFSPQFPNYITHMRDLPKIIKKVNLLSSFSFPN
ncbi:MAG: HAD hydrolase-like protein [Candidatus Lokiarchaeota archaeon]